MLVYSRGMSRTLLPALLFVSLAGLSLSGRAGAAFVSQEYGFTTSTPAGWKQVSYPGVLVAYASPTVVDRFATNVNVTVETLPAGMTLAQYIAAGQANLKRLITDFKAIGVRNTTLSGSPARQQTFSGRQGEFNLYFTQTVTVHGGRAYVLTGTSLLSQTASLSGPMAAFETMRLPA